MPVFSLRFLGPLLALGLCILLLTGCPYLVAPQLVRVSQNEYIESIRIEWESVHWGLAYHVERWNPETEEWQALTEVYGLFAEDLGEGLSGNRLQPGELYRYRVRASNPDWGDGPWSDEFEGSVGETRIDIQYIGCSDYGQKGGKFAVTAALRRKAHKTYRARSRSFATHTNAQA